MRKLLVALSAICCSLAALVPSYAGIAHNGNQLVCTDCHTMHYSMQHNYRGGSTDLVHDASGPFSKLLKASPNDLCLACHDGSGTAPDVLGNNDSGYVRQAGGLNSSEISQNGYQTWMGHTLGSKETAPGGTWADDGRGLLCIDCHAPHGIKDQWRNLWTSDIGGDKFQNKTVTFGFGFSSNVTKDVFLDIGDLDMASKYGAQNVHFNEPDPRKSAYANWCGSCHGDFHGEGGSVNMGGAHGGDSGSTPWKRHPTSDVNIGQNAVEKSSLAQYQSHVNKVQVMSRTGNWDNGPDFTPSCFSCHKAHGNKNPYGLVYMSGTGTLTEEGDTGGSKIENLCRQCHIQ